MAPRAASKVEVPEWLRTHYALVDEARLDEYMEDFSDDAELRFGAEPVLRGKEAIRARFAAGHATRKAHHDYHNVWEAGDTTIVEFDAVYTFPDGATVSASALVIIERSGRVDRGVARLHGSDAVSALSRGSEPVLVPQNIVLLFADVSGTGCATSQCSTILPSSKRKMSTTATPGSPG